MAQLDPLSADSRRWQDWVNLVLAVWLFISPWLLGFAVGVSAAAGAAPVANAAWDAWIFGIVTAMVALWAMSQFVAWQEWINLLIGIWLFVAPWILGFTSARFAAWDHWVVGIVVFLVSLSALNSARRPAAIDFAHAADKPREPPFDRP